MPLDTVPADNLFDNTQFRPVCDLGGHFIKQAELLIAEWTGKGLSTSIPNDATVVMSDGSQTGASPQPDGRTSITGADIWSVMNDLQTLVFTFQANSYLMQNHFLKPAVNP